MKLIDTDTREVIAEVMTDGNITIDEVLDRMRYSVLDDGQIFDDDNNAKLNAWYDNLDLVWA